MSLITQILSNFTNLINRDTMTPAQVSTAGDTTFSELQTILTELDTFKDQANALATGANTDATTATSQASLAADQVDLAEAQVALADAAAAAAISSANGTIYDTGKTGGYAPPDVVFAATGEAYRCIQTQAEGAVQALTATAYWVPLTINLVDDTTPQLGGDLDWNSKGNMLVGQTVGGTNGQVVYLSNANIWSVTDADAEATSKGMLGIRISATTVLTHGIYTTSGLTAASIYYLGLTAGSKTVTAPSATGDIIRIIGYALSTTEFFFDPDKTFVEVA